MPRIRCCERRDEAKKTRPCPLAPAHIYDYYGHMIVTSIASLKASLSEYLAGVKGGAEVIVTERGRPVARIVPYEAQGDEMDDLVRAGAVRPPHRPLGAGFAGVNGPEDPDGLLLRALLDERESGR